MNKMRTSYQTLRLIFDKATEHPVFVNNLFLIMRW